MKSLKTACMAFVVCVGLSSSRADLTTLGIWNGNVGLSIDAVGSNSSPVGTIQANVPVGSSILAAYLYSAGTPFPWYANSPTTLAAYNGAGITVNGTPITNFSALVGASALPDRPDIGNWFTARADVTPLVTSLVGAGSAVPFNFTIGEGSTLNNRIDGEVLAIVYSNPVLPLGSVALLDGGQNTHGETTTVNFGAPLGDVNAPGFFAEMSLGITFSVGPTGQVSQINVNGTRLTSSAGGFDDGVGSDGGLITAGGIGDSLLNPVAPLSNSSADDELYNLSPFLNTGASSFSIFTSNPSDDDNIFFMGLRISGSITSVNPPTNGVPDHGSTLLLLMTAMGGLVALRRRLSHA